MSDFSFQSAGLGGLELYDSWCFRTNAGWDVCPPRSTNDHEDLLGRLFSPDAVVTAAFLVGVVPDDWEEVEDKEPARPAEQTAEGGALPQRLRRRGVYTNTLAKLADSLPVWWEDLDCTSPARAAMRWMESHLRDSGVEVGVTSNTTCAGKEDVRVDLPLVQARFSSEEGGRWLWVCPSLLAHLTTVRLFRPASEGLLASLRAKSRLWAVEKGITVESLVRFLPGTLVLAMLPMPDEVVSLGALRGSAAQWSVDVLGALSRGEARQTSRGGSWWDVLKPSLRFGGTRGTTLGGAGCAPLRLAA